MASPEPSERTDSAPRSRGRGEEIERLEWMLKVAMGLVLVGAGIALARDLSAEEPRSLFPAITALVFAAAFFVHWSRLPFLERSVRDPGHYLGVFSKLILVLGLAGMPFLVVRQQYVMVAIAAALVVASIGLWMRWAWVAWLWYAILLGSFVEAARSMWEIAHGATSVRIAAEVIHRSFGALMCLAVLFELMRWQRELAHERRSAKATASSAPSTSSSTPEPPSEEANVE